jgi:hypothetical protein
VLCTEGSVLTPATAFYIATEVSRRNLCQFFSEPGLIETADIPSTRSHLYFAFLKRTDEVKETAALIWAKHKLTIIRPSLTLMSPGTMKVRK